MNSDTKLFIFALFAFISISHSHICLNYPPQRGGVPLLATNETNSLCGLITAPCGGQLSENATIKWSPGETVTIQIILNEQHLNLNGSTAGNITIGYCTSNCDSLASFTLFDNSTIEDSNMTTPAVLKVNVTVPASLTEGNIVVGIVYTTSPGEDPAAYYQCSDVKISIETDGDSEWRLLGFTWPYVAGAGGVVLLIIILIIIIIVVAVKRRQKKKKSEYYGGGDYSKENTRESDGKAIPMMNLRDIQSNLMATAPDSHY